MALDTSDIKNLSMREMMIIGFTLIFGVGYGYYEFEYVSKSNEIKKIKSEMTEGQTSLGAFQQLMKNTKAVKKTQSQIASIKQEITKLNQEIEKAKGRLKGQDGEILDELQNEADFYGVFLKSMRTSERYVNRSGLRVKEVSLIMEMESEYEALKNFIGSLGNSTAIIDIESLETKRVEKILPKVESRLHLKVMVL